MVQGPGKEAEQRVAALCPLDLTCPLLILWGMEGNDRHCLMCTGKEKDRQMGMEVIAYNPSSLETKAGGFP